MVTTRSEAFDLFSKWYSENTKIHCDLAGHKYALTIEGRIKELNSGRLAIVSTDTTGELVLKLDGDLEFAFGDSLESEHILIAIFRPFTDIQKAERISFLALETTS